MINRFIDAGRYELVLPLMQGFVGQREVSIATSKGDQNDSIEDAVEPTGGAPETSSAVNTESSAKDSEAKKFLLTLISRRSVKRAGLRYLRRGIDDGGNVANAVETEQLLSPTTWSSSDKVYSLVQTRGSIPLHFTQSPYSFKPTAVIHGSEATNQTALKKHFDSMSSRYGEIQAVSLVDKHPPENGIGQLYEDHVKNLNETNGGGGKPIGFEWFDFHSACKGMKFENVSILISSLESQLKSFSWTVEQDGCSIQQQGGVLRTNCMDCLDRSNVVQSAIASWTLERQLAESGLQIDLKTDPKTQWFNSLWADNGDAISKQYAGTAALKGDFTRTRKRNWTGALSDFSLSINRYYNNIFGDYFMQTCIDYFLGNASPAVFDEFETDMMAKDYALDMGRIRQNAIDTCVKTALEDAEDDLLGSWTLSCPNQANTLRSLPFEECVVLLTKAAFYFCRFDWETEKIASFEKVLLPDIVEIWRGAYITNAFGTNLDEAKNVGFALRYKPAENFMVRRNTRTLETDENVSEQNASKSESKKKKAPEKDQNRLLAFKALPPDSSSATKRGSTENLNEVEFVKHVCDKVHTAMKATGVHDHLGIDQTPELEERDIVSAADAKKNTGYVESIGYSLKKLVSKVMGKRITRTTWLPRGVLQGPS